MAFGAYSWVFRSVAVLDFPPELLSQIGRGNILPEATFRDRLTEAAEWGGQGELFQSTKILVYFSAEYEEPTSLSGDSVDCAIPPKDRFLRIRAVVCRVIGNRSDADERIDSHCKDSLWKTHRLLGKLHCAGNGYGFHFIKLVESLDHLFDTE